MKFVVKEKRKFNFVMLIALALIIAVGVARLLGVF